MNNTLTTLIIILNILIVKTQSLELQTFSSIGEQLTSTTGITVSNISGEIATEDLQDSDIRLTQGFHQLFKIISHSNDIEKMYEIIIYPNPTLDKITLKNAGADKKLLVHIYDSSGQLLKYSEFNEKTLTLPFADHPAGQYYAILRDKQGMVIDQIPFQKI